jgi:hypothetical protein
LRVPSVPQNEPDHAGARGVQRRERRDNFFGLDIAYRDGSSLAGLRELELKVDELLGKSAEFSCTAEAI